MARKAFLILFLLFQAFSSYAETLNSCKSNYSFLDTNKLENLSSISIEIKNSKKWMRNIFLLLRNNGWIPDEYKKIHRGEVKFYFNNNVECNFLAKIKFHGDNPDHIKRIDDFNILSSLNVDLIDSNIDNITEFKLFLPHTRGGGSGEHEIMTTNLLRELGFFAPRTKKILAKVNGINQEYLFQEKISKELIESYGFTEGPIIEGDQRLQKEGYRNFQLARIVNKNWAKKNWRNAYIALDSLSRVNELYIKFYNSIDNIDYNEAYPLSDTLSLLELDNYENDLYLQNLFYDKLLFSMGGKHALVPDNRTFYFNYIENNFYPIYYDGDIYYDFSINEKSYKLYNKNESLNKNEFSEFNPTLKKLKNLNLEKLQIKNTRSGVQNFKLDKLKYYIFHISKKYSEQLDEFKELKKNKIKNQNLNNFYKKINRKEIKLIFFNQKPNEFLICDQNINECDKKNISLDDIGEIISQRYNKNKKFIYIFVSSDYEKYKNNHSKVYENKWQTIDINENFYAKKTKEGISLKFDFENKEIYIRQENRNGRVIFFTKKEIKDWKINFSAIKNFNEENLLISKNDIDGCITFYNANFKNLTFITNQGFCEDSINMIRSKGSIKEIYINDAYRDGLDMDFSKIFINKINVNNSGNDCVDLSFGNYKINYFELTNCSDSGISVGEKSDLVSSNLSIKNSKTGIAVKDSSRVVADILNSKNNENCFKIYNKKQEFLGGNFILGNMNCNNNSYNVEYGSKFILKNDI